MSGKHLDPPRRRARAIWLKIHLYLGMSAGAVLVVLGITGSMLVFGGQIDQALNPQLMAAATRMQRVSPDEAIEAIKNYFGQPAFVLFTPKEGRGPYRALMRHSSAGDAPIREISVDSATGEILAGRLRGDFFISTIHELHTTLFLGEAGGYLIGGVSLLVLLSVVSGIYLWWPRSGAFRRAITFHWHRHAMALNFEAHRFLGFYLAGMLFVIALAGTYLALPVPFTAAVSAFASTTPWPDNVTSVSPAAGTKPLPLAAVAGVVTQRVPGAVITGYSLPSTQQEAYEVYFRGPAEPGSHDGHSALWIDQYSGRIMHSREYADLSAGDRFIDSQIRLHNGEILGTAGAWLVFIAGLTIPVMYATGFYLWWARRRAARRR